MIVLMVGERLHKPLTGLQTKLRLVTRTAAVRIPDKVLRTFFIHSLWPLSCFSRYVKFLIPTLSGRRTSRRLDNLPAALAHQDAVPHGPLHGQLETTRRHPRGTLGGDVSVDPVRRHPLRLPQLGQAAQHQTQRLSSARASSTSSGHPRSAPSRATCFCHVCGTTASLTI